MARLALTFALLGSITGTLLGGCNAVLGIEEATLRDDGAVQTGPLTVPIASCDQPKQNCGSCAANECKLAYPTCEGDHDCRDKLDEYRACLGSSCGKSGCSELLRGGGPASSELLTCIEGECRGCVDTSPLASMCELYCSCMLADCVALVAPDAVPWKPVDNWTSCLAECRNLGPATAHCRFSHCQLKKQGPEHCTHAVDDVRCPKDTVVPSDCPFRAAGWGCVENSQCCSTVCNDHICL